MRVCRVHTAIGLGLEVVLRLGLSREWVCKARAVLGLELGVGLGLGLGLCLARVKIRFRVRIHHLSGCVRRVQY